MPVGPILRIQREFAGVLRRIKFLDKICSKMKSLSPEFSLIPITGPWARCSTGTLDSTEGIDCLLVYPGMGRLTRWREVKIRVFRYGACAAPLADSAVRAADAALAPAMRTPWPGAFPFHSPFLLLGLLVVVHRRAVLRELRRRGGAGAGHHGCLHALLANQPLLLGHQRRHCRAVAGISRGARDSRGDRAPTAGRMRQ